MAKPSDVIGKLGMVSNKIIITIFGHKQKFHIFHEEFSMAIIFGIRLLILKLCFFKNDWWILWQFWSKKCYLSNTSKIILFNFYSSENIVHQGANGDNDNTFTQYEEDLSNDGPLPWCQVDDLVFVAEQVSHHPPISAFYAEHVKKRISVNAHIYTKSSFLGMSVRFLDY